jgi:hypothetical protein
LGSLALAHGFAQGTAAYAGHFNDAAAQAFAETTPFFRWSWVALRHLYWINLLWVIPMIVWWRVEKRGKAARPQ